MVGRDRAAAASGTVPPVHLLVRLELPDKEPREFSYDFRQDVISVGRDPNNDIQIPLTTVSRNHARIFYELGDFFLEDLGSTHGTSHNGRKLGRREKKLLRDGDRVDIMSFSVTFKTSTAKLLDRQPGEKTEQLARRMVQEVLASLGGGESEPTALRVMNGSDEGLRFEFEEDQAEVVIGRSPECDVVLDEQNTSRRHCLIKRTWNGFTAQDLGSKNGVLVNGKKIDLVTPIKDGDEVQIGGVKLAFIDPASRLLDQFGGFSDETVQPGAAPATPPPEEAEPPPEPAPEEDDDGFGDDDLGAAFGAGEEDEESYDEDGEEEEEGEEGAEGESEMDAEMLAAAAPRSSVAEVVILVLGLGVLATAIGLMILIFL